MEERSGTNILEQLYREDIADRRSFDINDQDMLSQMGKRDGIRREKLFDLHQKGLVTSALDFHHAALIMQHGETADDYKLAHQFAEKAVTLGDNGARWLYAATFDRWLMSDGQAQRYGTQIVKRKDGEYEVAQPVDLSVTDEEREKWHVPPLSEAVSKFKEKYGIK